MVLDSDSWSVKNLMRIVSLLPSATEIVCRLGLRDKLVGVSHECDYPVSVTDLTKVTSSLIPHDAPSRSIDELVREQLHSRKALYALDTRTLKRLEPHLIVTQTLCDVCAVAETEVQQVVSSFRPPPVVVNLEPQSLEDVFQSMMLIAEATGRDSLADEAIALLRDRVDCVAKRSSAVTRVPRVVVLEWMDPPFASGHWNPELVELAGGREMLGSAGRPSHRVSWRELTDVDPEVLVFSCCGHSLERTLEDVPILSAQPDWDRLSCVREHRVYAMDGSVYLSRPGPRLVDGLEILAHALHPELHPLPEHRRAVQVL